MDRSGWKAVWVGLALAALATSACASAPSFPGRVRLAPRSPAGVASPSEGTAPTAGAPANSALATPPQAVSPDSAEARPSPGLQPIDPAPAATAADTREPPGSAISLASTVMEEALALQGAPYRDGGTDPAGFDCSGFVQYVFGRAGVRLPRSTREILGAGERVDLAGAAPGDLVFFSTTGRGPTHVGILIEPDLFVHAPSEGSVVRVDRLSQSYWSQRFIGARRVLSR